MQVVNALTPFTRFRFISSMNGVAFELRVSLIFRFTLAIRL